MEAGRAVTQKLANNAKGDITVGELTGDAYPHTRIIRYLDKTEQPHYLLRQVAGSARKIALVIETNASRQSHHTHCVVATDKGVHFIAESSPGRFSGWSQLGHWNIPYNSIEAVDYAGTSTVSNINSLIKENRQSYELAFVTANRSYYVAPSDVSEAEALVNYVRNRINEPVRVQTSETDSALDKLERLEAMKDRGSITESEFKQQKNKLLDDI